MCAEVKNNFHTNCLEGKSNLVIQAGFHPDFVQEGANKRLKHLGGWHKPHGHAEL